MSDQPVGRFLVKNKDWKILRMVAGYLRARRMFMEMYSELHNGVFISFQTLVQLCDQLYEVKEDHHLLFKRLERPRSREFEEANKFTPGDVEIAFMNNVGLLFHKAMVAREVKYVIEHYEETSEDAAARWKELHLYLSEIERLFTVGLDILTEFIRLHRGNVRLLSYLIDQPEDAACAFGQEGDELLARFVGEHGLTSAYEQVANYYRDSGWPERARRLAGRLTVLDPGNQDAAGTTADLRKPSSVRKRKPPASGSAKR